MQWNNTSPFLPNLGYDPFSINKAPSYPQIIGEGDVTSVIFPDGSIQLYFVPTNRHVTLSPFQFNTNFPNHCTANKDIWFVRSISHPLGASLLNRQFPNVYGDQHPPPQFNPNCINSPPCPDYYQKFHNDDYTSTTDIHYFYPSLRYNGQLKYSAEIQTEPFAINTNALDGCQCNCSCKRSDTVKRNKYGDASSSSTSYMSIDSGSNSNHRLTKRNKKKSKTKANKNRNSDLETKRSKYSSKLKDQSCDFELDVKKSKYKSNKSSDQSCDCELKAKKSKYKSNKSSDQSCDCELEAKKSKYKSNKSSDQSCDCELEAKKSKYKSNKINDQSCDCELEAKKSKYKTNKREIPCDCNLETKQTSDKLVTTFAEQASGGIVKDGRQTQTDTQTVNRESKRSDVKTEFWIPIDCNSSSTLKVTCDNCSGQCSCRSTSETD